MSDFLTHLAARSLAPPTLRPRTLSRFEAESPAEAPENEEPQSVAHAEVRGTTARPSVATSPPASAVTHEEVIREHTHDVVREASTTRVVERREQVVHTETPAGTTQRQVNEEQPSAARRETSRDETRPALLPRREQRVPDASAGQRQPAFSPLVRGQVESRPALTQAREASISRESEPVIHVSIGRVEVRATTSAAPPRTARRNAAMTIDDYVARKNAKGRP
jgi:hypothetical protein